MKRFRGKALMIVGPLMLVSALGCGTKTESFGGAHEARDPKKIERVLDEEKSGAGEKKIEWKKQQGRYIWKDEGGKAMETLSPPEEYKSEKGTWKKEQGRWVRIVHDKITETSFETPKDLSDNK